MRPKIIKSWYLWFIEKLNLHQKCSGPIFISNTLSLSLSSSLYKYTHTHKYIYIYIYIYIV